MVRGKYNQNGMIVDYGETLDIVYVFPSPEKPSEEICNGHNYAHTVVGGMCRECGMKAGDARREVREEITKDKEDLERLKPEIKLPDKIRGANTLAEVTINLLIDAVREIERRGR